jgi:hypothetical protein
VGFFGRLTNLSKGWALSLGKKTDNSVVDTELKQDLLNPTPGPEAEAQLAALKAGTSPAETTQSTEPGSGESDRSETAPEDNSAEGPVKKTL